MTRAGRGRLQLFDVSRLTVVNIYVRIYHIECAQCRLSAHPGARVAIAWARARRNTAVGTQMAFQSSAASLRSRPQRGAAAARAPRLLERVVRPIHDRLQDEVAALSCRRRPRALQGMMLLLRENASRGWALQSYPKALLGVSLTVEQLEVSRFCGNCADQARAVELICAYATLQMRIAVSRK